MKRKPIGLEVLVVVGLVGLVLYYSAACLKERSAVKQVEQLDGYVQFSYYGPHWLVKLLGSAYPFKTVNIVELGMKATDENLSLLEPLKRAKMLFLNGTRVQGPGLTNLLGWSSLQYIDLTKSRITDEGLHFLPVLPRIKTLTLAGARVTDAGVAYLEKFSELRELNLQNTKVTDHCLQYLVGLPLKELDVRGTLVTSNGIAYLKKSNPTVDIVQ